MRHDAHGRPQLESRTAVGFSTGLVHRFQTYLGFQIVATILFGLAPHGKLSSYLVLARRFIRNIITFFQGRLLQIHSAGTT